VAKALWKMATVGIADMLAPVALFNFDLAAVGAIPVMVFAYHCHVQAVPIYYELTFDPVLFNLSKMRRAAAAAAAASAAAPVQQQHTEAAAASPAGTPNGDVATENVRLLQQTNGSSTPTPAVGGSPAVGLGAVYRTAGEVRRKLFGMARVLVVAYVECTVLYLATGIAGYILFPKDAQSNILKNFPADDVLMQVMGPLCHVLHVLFCIPPTVSELAAMLCVVLFVRGQSLRLCFTSILCTPLLE
jgi:amino acid permease